MLTRLKSYLTHPVIRELLSRGIHIDAPEMTAMRSHIIRDKPFLYQVYLNWYQRLTTELPGEIEGPVIELGSGGGFLNEVLPQVVRTEILKLPEMDLILDGLYLPFGDDTLKAVLMIDVFHHLPSCEDFLKEATRSLKPGGRIIMVEPWITPWSKFVYTYLHHEPINPSAAFWGVPAGGPLSFANSSLPWIVFKRDRHRFEHGFPHLRIRKIHLHTPFTYLLSGGVSLRSLLPGPLFNGCFWFEKALSALMPFLAMFATIVLEKETTFKASRSFNL